MKKINKRQKVLFEVHEYINKRKYHGLFWQIQQNAKHYYFYPDDHNKEFLEELKKYKWNHEKDQG